MQICPGCGEENPDKFRLCGYCGTALATREARQTARRTVTIVFSDLKGSTSLGERLDSESIWEVLAVYFDAMKAVLERHGGTVEKYIGDAIMAVFGLAQVHEDDALRAVRAAFEMRAALVEVNEKLLAGWGVTLENRTGVNTGEVVTGDPAAGQRLVTGDTVNLAARLEQAAPPNEVLIGESTYRLVAHTVDVEPVEPLELKGKSERIPAFRLHAVLANEAITRRKDTPMVGREKELATLREMFAHAIETRSCAQATVLGLPGLGKSRLVAELVRGLREDATVLQGRCLSYGDGTYWPLAEIARQAARIKADDSEMSAFQKLVAVLGDGRSEAADRLASVMGLSSTVYSLDETRWAARSLLEALSGRRPVVVVFDDIHWAEPTFLDLIEGLVDSSHDAPILIVCASRPELLEERPEWMLGRERTARFLLAELSVTEAALVVRNLLGDTGLPEALESRILEAAAGNPLFVEQMVAMLVDDGVLRESAEGKWAPTDSSATVSVPASISALLAARLDRLSAGERALLERASVIGQTFYPSALRALADDQHEGGLEQGLASLARKRLVAPVESDIDLVREEACQFVHLLVRDAAYGGLLKRARARLHERFGDWVGDLAGARLAEYEEIIGYHFEQAFQYRIELGQPGDEGWVLAGRAARHLRSSGERALSRGDLPAATSLLHRAANLLRDEDRAKPGLLLDVGDALTEMGELARAAAVLDEAVDRAATFNEPALAASARLAVLQLRYSTDPRSVEAQVVEDAEAAIAAFCDPEDHYVLGRAWRLLFRFRGTANMYGPAEEALAEVIRHAEARGDQLTARRVLGGLVSCAALGPSPVTEAIARCRDVLTRGANDHKVTALAQCAMARLEAMRGGFVRARGLYCESRATLEEFGWGFLAALTSIDSGPVELLAGDPEAAERELRRDFEALEAMDERNYISTVAALLASALYEQGRYDEAEELVARSAELAADDDVDTQYRWRCVRAKLLARRDRFDEAETYLEEAVALVDATDAIDAQGSVRLDLAEVYGLAGRSGEQAAVLSAAARCFERKGNLVSLAKARPQVHSDDAHLVGAD